VTVEEGKAQEPAAGRDRGARAAMGDRLIEPSPRSHTVAPSSGNLVSTYPGLTFDDKTGDYIGKASDQGKTHPEGTSPPFDRQLNVTNLLPFTPEGTKNALQFSICEGYAKYTREKESLLPRDQTFHDWNSCMLDTFNALVGRPILSRDNCKVPKLAVPISKIRPIIQKEGFELCRVFMKEGEFVPPQMQSLLQHTGGELFIVEYVYWSEEDKCYEYHVVGVDTTARVVFCNAQGVLPFSWKNKEQETTASHQEVEEALQVKEVLKVHCLSKKQAKKKSKKRSGDVQESQAKKVKA